MSSAPLTLSLSPTGERGRVLVLLAAVLAACSSPQPTPTPDAGACDGGVCPPAVTFCDAGTLLGADGACQSVGWSDCGDGFAPDPSGWGCAPVIAEACDAGTAPRLGQATCQPTGWLECDAGFTRHASGWGCDAVLAPIPADGGSSCSGATREAIGSPTCVPIGSCADAGFPSAAATIFVDDSFAVVDATHFRTIGAAITAAAPGATIAIESGTYAEAIAPNRPVSLVGRCPATVQIVAPNTAPALLLAAPLDVRIENVTLTGGLIGVRAEAGARITARHVVLDRNLRSGVQAVDSTTLVTLEDVVVRNALPDPASSTFGQGVAASFGAQLNLVDVTVAGSRETGIFLDRANTHLDGRRVVVSGTIPRASNGQLGIGLSAQRGATVDLFDSAIVANRASGVVVASTGSRVFLTNAVVARTGPGRDSAGTPIAIEVAVQAGGRLQLENAALAGAGQMAMSVSGAGSTATVKGAALRDLAPQLGPARAIEVSTGAAITLSHVAIARIGAPGLEALGGQATLDDVTFSELSGPAIRAQGAAQVTATGVSIDRAAGAGLLASAATATVTGCTVRDTQLTATADGGQAAYGAMAQEGGTLTLERCLIDGNTVAGLYANASTLTATSVIVRNTRTDPAGDYGHGAIVEHGGTLTLQSALLEKNHTSGLQASFPSSRIDATRVIVRDTLPQGNGTRGRGANAQFGGALSATRSAFLGNRQVSIFAFQSKVTLEDVLVRGTLADPGGAYGNGVEALTDGDIAMTRGAIEGSAGIAAVFAEGAGLLDAVHIARNAVGVHTQDGATLLEVESAPMTRGSRDVAVTKATVFEGNTTNVGTGQVPVPMP